MVWTDVLMIGDFIPGARDGPSLGRRWFDVEPHKRCSGRQGRSPHRTPLRQENCIPSKTHLTKAFILTDETTHYRTSDRGKSWHEWKVEDPPSMLQAPLVFSASKDDYIIYVGSRCTNNGGWSGFTCRDHAYYTTNGFEKSPKPMVEGVLKCMFARSSESFHEDHKRGVFCIDLEPDSSRDWPENLRL